MRVLVVDDHRPLADALTAMLCGCGHIARAAYDGAEALRVAEDFQPQAIISDVNMPEMNGFEVAKAVAECIPGCRVLLMSIEPYHAFLQPKGSAKIVTKPVRLTELLEFLREGG
ncbi:MAG TPA: response regulator [Bryobacteraceae bacterium]|nr:response regulator [Bryobacteraceae bacterium]